MTTRSAPTRTELVRLRRRLERVRTGAELLGRKRKALVAELFDRAGHVVNRRRVLREAAERAYAALREAQAAQGHAALRALGWPGRELPLELRTLEVWGVRAIEIVGMPQVRRGPEGRGLPPGAAGPATEEAAARFEAWVEALLDAASLE
ncbi:MAG: V-type ATP synthase subunit D, partial [Myxococcota bacterium]|nr:V-type ATP synthase subunit D [Myxococcota bacterium]